MARDAKKNCAGRVLLAALLALGTAGLVQAQTATGLGQSWPNAKDVSASPHWHVYVFVLNGIEYVQVNDLNGNVHTAVGTAGSASIVLPVGADAQNTTVGAPSTSSSSVVVYSDSTVTVTATPKSTGATTFTATPGDCDSAYNCGGGHVVSQPGS